MRLALAFVLLFALSVAPAEAAARPPHGILAHAKPDGGYHGSFKVRCATGGSQQVIRVGKDSRDVCPGAGKVDRIYVKARQVLRCQVGTITFDLFFAGRTYIIAAEQGGYSCVSKRP